MSNVWFTGDLHLGHNTLVLMGFDPFPFKDLEARDNAIIDNYNSVVERGDDVYIHGDFAWKDHNKYMARLKGNKHLIIGNHDKMSKCVSANFSSAQSVLFKVFYKRYMFFMSHYAHLVWPSSHYGSYHTYAHSHGRLSESDHHRRCDVGVVPWNLFPVRLETLIYKMQNKEKSEEGATREELHAKALKLAAFNKHVLEGTTDDAIDKIRNNVHTSRYP